MSAYMKIDGIDGTVTAKEFDKNIEIHSASFSVKRNMNTKPGAVADREGTKPSMGEVVITKNVDIASPNLFGGATAGSVIPTVKISFVNTGKDLSEYHSVTLSNVLISGYELVYADDKTTKDSEKDANAKPIERIALNYTKIEVRNTPYDKSHKSTGSASVGYDLETAHAA
jgi:type VI secretion system secreted protein Hcp